MVPTDSQAIDERVCAAFIRALSDASGTTVELLGVVSEGQSEAYAGLGTDPQVHIEFELTVDRSPAYSLAVAGRAADLLPLFGMLDMPETALPSDSDGQIALLAGLTDSAETIAAAFSAALSARGAPVAARVSGTSVETPVDAQRVHPGTQSNTTAVRMTINAPGAGAATFSLVSVIPPQLAAVLSSPVAGESQRNERRSTASSGSLPEFAGGSFASTGSEHVTAHPYRFGQLEAGAPAEERSRSLEPILDVPLHVRVELGSTEMLVEEVLSIGVGSIIELDRLAGEPVDIVVNDRLIARGEVVVVEESFGVRITEIVRHRMRANSN